MHRLRRASRHLELRKKERPPSDPEGHEPRRVPRVVTQGSAVTGRLNDLHDWPCANSRCSASSTPTITVGPPAARLRSPFRRSLPHTPPGAAADSGRPCIAENTPPPAGLEQLAALRAPQRLTNHVVTARRFAHKLQCLPAFSAPSLRGSSLRGRSHRLAVVNSLSWTGQQSESRRLRIEAWGIWAHVRGSVDRHTARSH